MLDREVKAPLIWLDKVNEITAQLAIGESGYFSIFDSLNLSINENLKREPL